MSILLYRRGTFPMHKNLSAKTVQKLIDEVKKTCDEYKMFHKVNKAVIAFSAGPDSVCLLDVLSAVFGKKVEFELAYVNHGLRAKPILRREEQMVEAYAARYGLNSVILRINITKQKEGIEATARIHRYRVLGEYLNKTRAQRIVLGHNMDDFVETFLLNVIRGSGMRGFRSIPPVRLPFVRPLINSKKSDILRYLKTRKLPYAVDQTNLSLDYRRNLIRMKILPMLQKINPEIHEAIKREVKILKRDDEYLAMQAGKAYLKIARLDGDCVFLDLNRLVRYNDSLSSRIVMKALQDLRGNLDGYESKHYSAVINLMHKEHGKRLSLPKGLYAVRELDRIVIAQTQPRASFDIPLDISQREVRIGNYKVTLRVLRKWNIKKTVKEFEVFDMDALELPLHLRNRRFGDYIQTKIGSKKVKKIFSEKHVMPRERGKTMILCDQKGILWIFGIARAFRGFIGKKTKRFLVVGFERLD